MLAFGAAKSPSAGNPGGFLKPDSGCRGGLFNSRSCLGRDERTRLQVVSELVGASEETGGVFDPLGLATDEVSRRISDLHS